MKFNRQLLIASFAAAFLILPLAAFAHQPRLATGNETVVTNPEISKAYYAKLAGGPQYYRISSAAPFDLYVNILAPDIAGQKKDISAEIVKDNRTDAPLAVLDGMKFDWKYFWEPFGHDGYWMGPEYRAKAEAGEYVIKVWSANNDSKYSLAVGEIEAFNFTESAKAINLIPRLKRDFFNESPAGFIFSPFGWGYIILMYALVFIIELIVWLAVRKRSFLQNQLLINYQSTIINSFIAIGVILLIVAIMTTWNPVLIFLSGAA
ncbi:MAG: hypothetical protein V1928_05085, partial [Parcubacteria group bacterium]